MKPTSFQPPARPHRASVEGINSPAPVDMLRLSTGIEDADDLIADLEQGLAGN